MQLPHLIIENAGTWSSPPEPTFSRPRFVLRYELEYYLGEVGETWIDGERFELRRGTVLFARPSQLRFSRLPFCARFLYFDVPNTPEFTEWLATLPCCVSPSANIGEALEIIARRLHEDDYTARLELQTRLFDCLVFLSRAGGYRTTPKKRPKQDEVFRAIRYMKAHLYEPCSVADFAAQTGYSVPHFNAFFRELLGTRPYEYYMRLKMLEAKRLLLSGRHNSAEISRLLGFSSSSHFCVAFRESTGQTPRGFVSTFRHENALPDEMP